MSTNHYFMKLTVRNPLAIVCISTLVLLIVGLTALGSPATGQETKAVFILHSYNLGYPFSDNERLGIDGVFAKSDLKIESYITYMDMKRIPPTPQNFAQLRGLIKEAYKNVRFDAILVCDNDALEFMRKYRDELFPGVPLVFTGINNFKKQMLDERKDITGTVESADYAGTIRVALKIRPKTNSIVVVTDDTTTGKAHISEIEKIRHNFPESLNFINLSLADTTLDELAVKLSKLDSNSIVLLVQHFIDKNGKSYSLQESTLLLAKSSSVPVFVTTDSRMGLGVLGGHLIGGVFQGETAAEAVVKILKGTDISTIPLLLESPNKCLFDYTVMQRFDIAESALPEGSIVLNRPVSILDQYRNEILGITISFLALISILIILGVEVQHRRNLNKKLSNNIVERKKIEAELRKSETKFKALFEQAGDYILILALQPNAPPIIVDANQAAIEKHGFLREEFVGRPISDLDDKLNKELIIDRAKRIISGEHLIFETVHSRKDGSIFPVEASVSLLKTEEDASLLISIERDITERKMAEEQLQVQGNILNKSQEIAHLGSWHLDIKRNFLTWSDEQYRIFGKTPQEFGATYEAFLDTIHPDDKVMVDNAYTHAITNNLPYECIHRIIRDDGEVRVVLEKSEDVVDENGKTIHSYGFTQDITEQTRREQERKELESRLVQAQKMETIGALAGGIAHDFNNILSVIIGYTDMAIEDAGPDSKITKDLKKVLTSSHRAKDLVKQILAFSRQSAVDRIPIQIQPLIKESLKMLRASIPTTISITEDIHPQCGVVLADPTQIHQILMNLCTNAYQAMEETGGELSVTLKTAHIASDDQQKHLHLAPGEYVELIVSDTGRGIGADIIDKIFDPFFTTKEIGKGTGMGLSIIHGIMKDYGGTVSVESQLGKGSAFHMYFPVVEKEALPEIKEFEKIPLGTERILFIDDEELLAEMGKDMLERLDYHVTIRRSSLEALETFQNTPNAFDLVITDQTMPGITGYDISRRMLQIRPDIPIILCTGYSNLIDEHSAKILGIKEFALKPLTKGVIAKLIRKVLDGKVH